MHTTNIMFGRKKKGMSTILGTIIFVGILFTSFVPMMLVMKQADNIYTRKIHEMQQNDELQAAQELEVFAYPVEDEDQIKVWIENVGVVPATVHRIWVNDVYITTDESISALDAQTLGPYNVTTFDGAEFDIIVTTVSANSYPSVSGTLHYETEGWFVPELAICVHVSVGFWGAGSFKIWITNSTWQSDVYESGFIWLGNIVEIFNVVTPGNYKVWVERKGWFGDWEPLDGSPQISAITYPNGPPIVTVTFGS